MARFRIFFGNPPPAGAGELSGSATMTFATTALLVGTLALSGTGAATFGQSGTLKGTGALAGSTAVTFGQSGTLAGTGALAGSDAVTFGATGTLEAKVSGAIDGTASFAFGATGDLSAIVVAVPLDLRELILRRVQYAVQQVAPANSLTFPNGFSTAPFLTDLKGRAYSRHRGVIRLDEAECPYAEVLVSGSQPDVLEAMDEDTYACTVFFDVIGYDRADDQGDGLDADVRMRLHTLGSDLRMAVEAAPYAVGTEPQDSDPLGQRVGGSLKLTLLRQDAIVADDAPFGIIALGYQARYVFNVRYP